MRVVSHPKIRRSDQTLAGGIVLLAIPLLLLGLLGCLAALVDQRNWTGNASFFIGLTLLIPTRILVIGSLSLRNGTPSGYGGWIAGGLLLGALVYGLVPGVAGWAVTFLWLSLALLGSVRAIGNR